MAAIFKYLESIFFTSKIKINVLVHFTSLWKSCVMYVELLTFIGVIKPSSYLISVILIFFICKLGPISEDYWQD